MGKKCRDNWTNYHLAHTGITMGKYTKTTEPVFLNVYGAQESIPRNEFLQPM
jgi:hypothetical protein